MHLAEGVRGGAVLLFPFVSVVFNVYLIGFGGGGQSTAWWCLLRAYQMPRVSFLSFLSFFVFIPPVFVLVGRQSDGLQGWAPRLFKSHEPWSKIPKVRRRFYCVALLHTPLSIRAWAPRHGTDTLCVSRSVNNVPHKLP